MVEPLLCAESVQLSYARQPVLRGVSFAVDAGETVAVLGASGSGKSTLLRVLSGIELAGGGNVSYKGYSMAGLSDAKRSELRLREFGFVFQFGDLVPELTVEQNIELPLDFLGVRRRERRQRVQELVGALGLAVCAARRPHTLSGGERQRVAVARAVAHRPKILFADEPTGSLDGSNRMVVARMLLDLCGPGGCAMVMVTHDEQMAAMCSRVVRLEEGRIAGESARELAVAR
ncbi:MAG: ABC transporter ATP-binding protein [Bifidobacteriaceae bacterium]|jgi:putative ABC transport system ATP-binding protein|nr:ABC transporter ATP-binding protein [Bifidobacteriaceae bacterium]